MVILIANEEDLYNLFLGSRVTEPWAEECGWWSGLDEDPLDQTLCFFISNLS